MKIINKMNTKSMYQVPLNEQLFILNEKNKLITKQFINNIFKTYNIDHRVNRLSLYVEATVHYSYCVNKCLQKQNQKDIYITPISDPSLALPLMNEPYERLEFLGDSVLHTILTEYLLNRYPEEYEGFLTRLRTKLENTEMLAKFSKLIGLNEYAVISRYVEANDGRTKNDHIMEDLFESFIGALYLDTTDKNTTNFDKCKKFIVQLVEKEVDIAELLYNENNYKDMLLQYAHKMKWPDPLYGTCGVSTPHGDQPQYKMFAKINGEIAGVGIGVSKKKGEQLAAKEALKEFGVIKDESDDECSDDEYIYECE